jgi:hypothetical protein
VSRMRAVFVGVLTFIVLGLGYCIAIGLADR